MAMSFSRPDPASPAQVADATFSTGRRGFDQDEVRDFLRMVSAELGRLHERTVFLERELRSAQSTGGVDASQLDDEALTRLLGEETVRVLNAARESANEIREKAEQSAAQLLTEASDEASRRREEAEVEASRRRADAANDAEAELSMAKQQGREMVNEARAYRERVLSELARRRELAREQIEQLIHGRDRLMQAFERARVVAVDVVAEMQPLGEPDEYVNLQPTTGPVPVMVARDHTPREAGQVEAGGADADPDVNTVDSPHTVDAASEPDGSDAVEADVADAEIVALPTHPASNDEVDAADVETAGEVDEDEAEVVADAHVDAVDDEVEDTADDVEALSPDEAVEHDDVAVADELTAQAERAGGADDIDDDVVVDLFARLRSGATDAETGPVTEAEAADTDAATDAETGPVTDDEAAPVDDEVMYEATVFEQRDADLTPLIVAGAKKLKRVLADEQNEVLDGLRRHATVAGLDAILPSPDEHMARYRSALADDFVLAANAGAQVTSPEKTVRLRKAQANDAVDHAGQMVDDWLVGPLRDRIERCVSEGDGDNTVVTKKVRAVYREWKTRHIDETLDDVMRAAHGRGALAAIEPESPTVWTPDPRHDACPDCDDNALAGAVASGEPFPTGHTFAPAHPGCRCMLLAVAP